MEAVGRGAESRVSLRRRRQSQLAEDRKEEGAWSCRRERGPGSWSPGVPRSVELVQRGRHTVHAAG